MNKPAPIPPTVEEVKRLVAHAYGITVAEMESSSMRWEHSWPRQNAMFIVRDMCRDEQGKPLTTRAIATLFKRSDHGTVRHACKMVVRYAVIQPATKVFLEAVIEDLKRGVRH